MSQLFDSSPYGGAPAQAYYGAPQQDTLQFYSGGATNHHSNYYGQGATGLEGHMGSGGSHEPDAGAYGSISGQIQGGFWSAFTPGGYTDEPPLLEELGINFVHIKAKSLAALNPLRRPDQHIMDDADLAGPLLFCFCFGMFLLFSGKPQFGYIYGVGLLGVLSLYFLLNLMSPSGINFSRVASVLGYCLLPLVLMSMMSVAVSMDGMLGYLFSSLSILWCSYSASGIFVSVLQMTEQRFLVAYPVALFYSSFALLSVFNVSGSALAIRA